MKLSTYWLISYDIADPKRLRRVEKAIAAVGMRLHYSLFYCDLTESELLQLQRRLAKMLAVDVDTVQYTPWCARDMRLSRHMGTSSNPNLSTAWVV